MCMYTMQDTVKQASLGFFPAVLVECLLCLPGIVKKNNPPLSSANNTTLADPLVCSLGFFCHLVLLQVESFPVVIHFLFVVVAVQEGSLPWQSMVQMPTRHQHHLLTPHPPHQHDSEYAAKDWIGI